MEMGEGDERRGEERGAKEGEAADSAEIGTLQGKLFPQSPLLLTDPAADGRAAEVEVASPLARVTRHWRPGTGDGRPRSS